MKFSNVFIGKKANFTSIIGFFFAFFIVTSMIIAMFLLMIDNVQNQVSTLEGTSELIDAKFQDFDLNSVYYGSGRVYFDIENLADRILKFRDSGSVCFNLFVNSQYVSTSDFTMETYGSAAANYDFIVPKGSGVISFDDSLINFSEDNLFELVSCDGILESISLDSGSFNWFDSNWNNRILVDSNNPSSNQIEEYQIEVDLDSNNLDFSLVRLEELRVAMQASETFKLDLSFDEYTQTIEDFSNIPKTVYLGSTDSADGQDPAYLEDGVVLSGLSFDGTDSIVILSDSTLVMDSSLTYSAWVRWDMTGGTSQYLFDNSWNSLEIVNDGGANDNKILFKLNVSGTMRSLYSTSVLDNDWHHVVASYDGRTMRIYLDSELDNSFNVTGSISSSFTNNYIGSNSGTSNFFVGDLDEVKIINHALSDSNIVSLYQNSLTFLELDFYAASWDSSLDTGKLFVKVPAIGPSENVSFGIYYDYSGGESLSSMSSIEDTFSYSVPRLVGYVVNEEIADTTGLTILSLYDNNEIIVGSDSWTLDEQAGTTLASGSTEVDDDVYMKYLANVQGNSGGTDIVVPISWAGTSFSSTQMDSSQENICMLSPFGTANYEIFENGGSIGSGTVSGTGLCRTDLNLGTASNLYISSDIPILVSYSASSTGNIDSHVLYPISSGNYYGGPDISAYVTSGGSSSDSIWYLGDGTNGVWSLASYGVDSILSAGSGDGISYGLKVVALDGLSILKQSDGDGDDMVTILPEDQMGIKFGSNEAMDYVVFVSPHSDANCSVYDSTETLLQNIVSGSGSGGAFNYSFGNVGTDNQFATSGWKLECSKPGNVYYENIGDDEINMFGHLQMRQYNYPEPVVSIQ